jgi:hypothetical protein
MADAPPPPNSIDVEQLLRDAENLDPLAQNLHKRTADNLKKLGIDAATANKTGGIVGAGLGLLMAAISLIVSIIVFIGDPLVRIFLRALTKVRTESVPEQLDISAAVLSEFLAVDINPDHLKSGKTGDATIDAARAIGDALLGRLTKEFAPSGEVTPESGENAAKAFAGYGVNFAVQNTMIGTLADALSFHLLEDFRELGVDVAKNIGLGRLVRQALLPLVRNTIAEPYDQQLRKRYRPDLLSEQHAVDAFFSGFLTDVELKETLSRKGYSDTLIGIVIERLRKKITESDLDTLLRYNVIPRNQAEVEVQSQGYTRDNAVLKLRVQELQRVDTLIGLYKSLISKQRTDGLLDEDAYLKLLDRLPISDDEKQWELNYTGQVLELPRSFLSWTEVKNAFEQGAVDLDYVDRWLAREGFSDEDQLVRELLLFAELGKKLDKAQAAADKAARKTGQKPQ